MLLLNITFYHSTASGIQKLIEATGQIGSECIPPHLSKKPTLHALVMLNVNLNVNSEIFSHAHRNLLFSKPFSYTEIHQKTMDGVEEVGAGFNAFFNKSCVGQAKSETIWMCLVHQATGMWTHRLGTWPARRAIDLSLQRLNQYEIWTPQKCRKHTNHVTQVNLLIIVQLKMKIRQPYFNHTRPNSLVVNHVMPVSCWIGVFFTCF